MSTRRTIARRLVATVLALLISAGVAYLLIQTDAPPDEIAIPEPAPLLPVCVDGRWGTIDPDGRVVIPIEHDELHLIANSIYSNHDRTFHSDPSEAPNVGAFGSIDASLFPSALVVTLRSQTIRRYRREWPFIVRKPEEVVTLWSPTGEILVQDLLDDSDIFLEDGLLTIGSHRYRAPDQRLLRIGQEHPPHDVLPDGKRLVALSHDRATGLYEFEIRDGADVLLASRTAAAMALVGDDILVVMPDPARWISLADDWAYLETPNPETLKYPEFFPLVPPSAIRLTADTSSAALSLGTLAPVSIEDMPILNRPDYAGVMSWDRLYLIQLVNQTRDVVVYLPEGGVLRADDIGNSLSEIPATEPEKEFRLAASTTHLAIIFRRSLSIYTQDGERIAHTELTADYLPIFTEDGAAVILESAFNEPVLLCDLAGQQLATVQIIENAGHLILFHEDGHFGILDSAGKRLQAPTYVAARITDDSDIALQDDTGKWRHVQPDGQLSPSFPSAIRGVIPGTTDQPPLYRVSTDNSGSRSKPIAGELSYGTSDMDRVLNVGELGRVRYVRVQGWSIAHEDGTVAYTAPDRWTYVESSRQFLVASEQAGGQMAILLGDDDQPDGWHRGSLGGLYRTRVVDLSTFTAWPEPLKYARILDGGLLYVEYWDGRIGYMRPDHTWLWPPQK